MIECKMIKNYKNRKKNVNRIIKKEENKIKQKWNKRIKSNKMITNAG